MINLKSQKTGTRQSQRQQQKRNKRTQDIKLYTEQPRHKLFFEKLCKTHKLLFYLTKRERRSKLSKLEGLLQNIFKLFLFIILETYIKYLNCSHFPVFPSLLPLHYDPQNKKTSPFCVVHIFIGKWSNS